MHCIRLLMSDHNQLSGTLPASWSSIAFKSDGMIILDYNVFEGSCRVLGVR
ncbi:GP46-like surface antigen, putative [Bodo saltans]|uniref:GP46-like surface antigen, putative n=1 Tax=Bodo saltans TaxID=75058 RepID=A0A0S4J4B4_BODSA|nr:GP46-like surface antigen, putative [Bodo saltans]|eukprot:CUG78364.1 GP46-like surface antigen, putative [Bodo saltans]